MFALHFSFLVVWLGTGLRTPDPSKPSMRQMLELQLLGLLESTAATRTARRTARLVEITKWKAPK